MGITLIRPSLLGISTQAGSTPVGGHLIVRRSADSAAKTDNTLASDDTLLWAVAANEVWAFQGLLFFNGANVTMDLKVGWAYPAGATMKWGLGMNVATGAGSLEWAGAGTAPSSVAIESTAVSAGTGAGTDIGSTIDGVVVVGATAGDVNLQWAQNTTDAGALKLLANSFIRAIRLA